MWCWCARVWHAAIVRKLTGNSYETCCLEIFVESCGMEVVGNAHATEVNNDAATMAVATTKRRASFDRSIYLCWRVKFAVAFGLAGFQGLAAPRVKKRARAQIEHQAVPVPEDELPSGLPIGFRRGRSTVPLRRRLRGLAADPRYAGKLVPRINRRLGVICSRSLIASLARGNVVCTHFSG